MNSKPWRKHVVFFLLCSALGSYPSAAHGQCPDTDVPIRQIEFEMEGENLEQIFSFYVEGEVYAEGEDHKNYVTVHKAYWLGENEVLLWGRGRPKSELAGLFLLTKSQDNDGFTTWSCQWRCHVPSDSMGEYRNLAPVSVKVQGEHRLLTIDVQDETSIGTLLVAFHNGKMVMERFLWFTALDSDSNWGPPCPTLDSMGGVHFPASGIYELGWGETASAYIGVELVLRSGDSVLAPVTPVYLRSKQRGVSYRVALGNVVLAPGSKVPSGERLVALASEVSAVSGLSAFRMFASERALEGYYLSFNDVEVFGAVRDAGYLGEWSEGRVFLDFGE